MSSLKLWLRNLANPRRAARQLLLNIEWFLRRGNSDRAAAARLKKLTQQRRHAEAVGLAAELLHRYGGDVELVRLASSAFRRAGAITRQLEAIRAERRIADRPELAKEEEKVLGRWLETSPNWRPEATGATERLTPNSNRRILHILKAAAPYRQSGYTMRTRYILEAQFAVGLEPIAMTSLGFPKSHGVAGAPEMEEIAGVSYIRLDDGTNPEIYRPTNEFLRDYVAAAAAYVRKLAPAVIHAHSGSRGYDGALVGLALGRHFKLPVVYEVRGFFESLWTPDVAWSERSELYDRRVATENRCLSDADAVVTLSGSMRAEIVRRGIDPKKVFVVPNGVDATAFYPKPRPANLVEQYGLEHSFVFGYISNLDHFREGQEALVDAAIMLREQGIPARALIVGDGKRRAALQQYVSEREAGSAVIFTGQVPHEDVLDYYAVLDVFVVPRVQERAARLVSPLKPFEAMAAGVPLVVSDLDALREIVGNDGERGRCFGAGDAASLADVLAELYADPGQCADLAERARDWVIRERQWSANGSRYAEIYARVLEAQTST